MLRTLPVRAIIRAICDAADRWSDADFPPRVRVTDAIVERTGYSVPVVEYALDQLFFSIEPQVLESTIVAELGSLDALDGFVPRAGRPDAFARGVDRVCILSSRTTIGVGLVPAIFALCAKSEVTVKDREDYFIAAFFETLAEEHNAFARAATARTWSGAEQSNDLGGFDAIVAFGKNKTLQTIREHAAPGARFIGFGSRASAGYITRETLHHAERARELARGAARDLVLYESEGCLSLHVLFAEAHDDANVQSFLKTLAEATQGAGLEFPIGKRDPGDVARMAQFRAVAAFRAAGGQGAVYSDDVCSYVLVYDPPSGDPPPFAPRCLSIIPVREPAQAAAYVRAHHIELEGFALSDGRRDVVESAVNAGAVRLAAFGELQRLPVSADHGGRPRIADYIRW
ncbi:MAG: hypothetical protein M3126_11490, partial [Candidatus Eremiobacteraeota bacterium]|nr:hypothetical protein [Candidatus Eremiobacteraeota bacterium]